MDIEILQEYRKKVVVFILGIICFSATAAIVLPGMKYFGLYPTVSWKICIIFIMAILLEDIFGIYLIKKV